MYRLSAFLASTLLACGNSGSTATATASLTTVSAGATATDAEASAGDTTAAPAPTGETGSAAATTGAGDLTTSSAGSTGADATAASDDSTSTGSTSTGSTSTSSTSSAATTAGDGSSTSAAAVCGDAVVEPGEACDDGLTPDCAGTHDGGDGTCVPAGECSPGYVLADAACVPERVTAHVHIMVSNTCDMTVDPESFTVQPGQQLKLEYHNHSADYPVDVWMHYNGGFTDLEPGGTWKEQYEHCFGPAPSEGYADISTACSEFHLPIHCL
ncbi:MAG: hypothetical protein JNL82_40900 [Myxococcales bacterium]|nr:hypothetical protein [Myxococcales bacterium]